MSRHTNFRIGGPVRYFVEARTPEEIAAAVDVARSVGLQWFILGGGSNTLVGDAGFDGLVIQVALRDVVIDGGKNDPRGHLWRVCAGAGAIAAAVARQAGDAGLTGFEWAVSLPGTIGGAVRGNAGCFGGEMKDVVEHVRVLDGNHESRIMNYGNEACDFHYRRSIFKEYPEWIILEATLTLRSDDPKECQRRMNECLERRKASQPHDKPSAGCLFKNVEMSTLTPDARERLEQWSSGAWRSVAHDGQIPVGWLVDRLGCKGRRVGNAQISERHGNFTLNLGGATAADILALGEEVRRIAREQLDIAIEYEVQRLGCDSGGVP